MRSIYEGIQARSRLFSLIPIGVGTSDVESIASYFSRLAEAHSVSPTTLMRKEVLPILNRMGHSSLSLNNAFFGAILGVGKYAAHFVKALEELTCRTDLKSLNMARFSSILPTMGLVRDSKVWCPHCLQESSSKMAIYEPLLWALKPVNICIKHGVNLVSKCPNLGCNLTIPFLGPKARCGYCPYCGTWLGVINDKPIDNLKSIESRMWASTCIGDFLSLSSNREYAMSRERLAQNIARIIDTTTKGNDAGFARIIGVAKTTMLGWTRAENLPPIGKIVQICAVGNVQIIQLFTEEIKIKNSGVGFRQSQEKMK